MKVTVTYINQNPLDPSQGQFEFGGDLTSLWYTLNEKQFVDLTARVPKGDNVYERRTILVNRDDIAQVIEGWLN